MKKILFNDKYLLTQAVLRGEKTQTRRKFTLTLDKEVDDKLIRIYPSKVFFDNGKWLFDYEGRIYNLPKENYPRYKIGEVVAIAQSYNDISKPQFDNFGNDVPGNTNKMFVKAELMPHKIKITNVRIERLQDITDEDCLHEGIAYYIPASHQNAEGGFGFQSSKGGLFLFDTARKAFAALVDKVSGKGTWESNPYVWVYDFKLGKKWDLE